MMSKQFELHQQL